MEFENVNQKGLSKKFIIPLIVILVLIVILCVLGVFIVFKEEKPKDVYLGVIDNLNTLLMNNISSSEKTNKYSVDGDIDFKITSNNSSYKEISNIINNMKINYLYEYDKTNEMANYDMDIKYKNNDLINACVNVLNNDIYLDLGDLYDKKIKVNFEQMSEIWNFINVDESKIIYEELVKSFKNSLKEEYFAKENETLSINGKKKQTIKYIMNLNSDNIYNIEIDTINNLKNDNVFVEKMADLLNYSESEIKDEIQEYLSEMEQNEDLNFTIEIYINRFNKNIEKLSIKNEDSEIQAIRESESIYNLNYIDNDGIKVIGAYEKADNGIKFNIQNNGALLKIEVKDKDIEVSYKNENTIANISFENNVSSGNKEYAIDITTEIEDIKVTVSANGTVKDIDSITTPNISNYIEIDKLDSTELQKIYLNLYSNKTLMSLISDIQALRYISEY